jgi:hypothetical protein
MTKTTELKMTPKQRQEAVEWFKECSWADADEDHFDDLTDTEIEKYVQKHFAGGIEEFQRISLEAA